MHGAIGCWERVLHLIARAQDLSSYWMPQPLEKSPSAFERHELSDVSIGSVTKV